jgi:hypothetical protein
VDRLGDCVGLGEWVGLAVRKGGEGETHTVAAAAVFPPAAEPEPADGVPAGFSRASVSCWSATSAAF